MNEKQCSRCREVKELTEFSNNKRSKDGKKSACKKCLNKAYAAYRKSPDARKKAYARKQKYLETEKGRTKKRQDDARYAKTKKGRTVRKLANEAYRSRKVDAYTEPFTRQELLDEWVVNGIDPSICYYCNEAPYEHLDHFVPLAKGGAHAKWNLVPSCACCNQSKGSKLPQDFIITRSRK